MDDCEGVDADCVDQCLWARCHRLWSEMVILDLGDCLDRRCWRIDLCMENVLDDYGIGD